MPNDLDAAFAIYSTDRDHLGNLVTQVRAEALKITRDDDATQDVCIVVLESIACFVAKDDTSFSRWVRSIARHRRLRLIPTLRSKLTDEFDEKEHADLTEDDFADLEAAPSSIQHIAWHLLCGESIGDIAAHLNIASRSVQKKVRRACLQTAT